MNLQAVNGYVAQVAACMAETPRQARWGERLYVGLDLGTCFTVLVVLGEDLQPLACEMERSDALKDGVVVDYAKACDVVRRLKRAAERKLGAELTECVIAMPPGTEHTDGRTHSYVASSSGMDVAAVVDEPSAANLLLRLADGAVVDMGGGTTGISVIEQGRVVHSGDQPTGGIHLTLVIAGGQRISVEEAEAFKLDPGNQKEVLGITTPVIEKMARIVLDECAGYQVRQLCLAGGTCCLNGVEDVFRNYTGLAVFKPDNPLLITPIGIAMAHQGQKE